MVLTRHFKVYILLPIVIIFFSNIALAKNTSQITLKSQATIPWQMYEFQKNMITLSQYFNDLDAYASKKNHSLIRKHLKEMIDLSEGLEQHKRLKSENYNIPIAEFKPHLRSVLEMYDAKRYKMSLWRLKASVHACDQCHSKIQSNRPSFWTIDHELTGLSPFQKADLYFVLRDYEQAKRLFKVIIYNEHPEKKVWQASVDRMLSILVKVEGAPKKFLFEIEQILKNKDLIKFQKEKYTVWKSELKSIIDSKTPNTLDINKFMAKVYPIEKANYSKEIRMQYLANFLNKHLSENTQKISGEVYYWLGVIDLELNHQLFFSFGENYLKMCINQNPKTQIAKKCYSTLEEYITLGYTGSQGEFVPYDVQQELKSLKKNI